LLNVGVRPNGVVNTIEAVVSWAKDETECRSASRSAGEHPRWGCICPQITIPCLIVRSFAFTLSCSLHLDGFVPKRQRNLARVTPVGLLEQGNKLLVMLLISAFQAVGPRPPSNQGGALHVCGVHQGGGGFLCLEGPHWQPRRQLGGGLRDVSHNIPRQRVHIPLAGGAWVQASRPLCL
jgi:hypothetical protein